MGVWINPKQAEWVIWLFQLKKVANMVNHVQVKMLKSGEQFGNPGNILAIWGTFGQSKVLHLRLVVICTLSRQFLAAFLEKKSSVFGCLVAFRLNFGCIVAAFLPQVN